jgi:hypothetical protein
MCGPRRLPVIRYSRTKALAVIVVMAVVGTAVILLTRGRESTARAPRVAEADDPNTRGSSATRRLDPVVSETSTPPPVVPAPRERQPDSSPTHRFGPKCEGCTKENCTPTTDGCDELADATDRKLCEELYACFTDPANVSCVIAGDPTRCWCGTHLVSCVTDDDGPKRANGPCVNQVLAAARSEVADTIWKRFLDPSFPVGRAVRLTTCRGAFCPAECKVN